MINAKRCYECGNWFDDPDKKKYLLCPKCRAAIITAKYVKDPETREIVIHCKLPRNP